VIRGVLTSSGISDDLVKLIRHQILLKATARADNTRQFSFFPPIC